MTETGLAQARIKVSVQYILITRTVVLERTLATYFEEKKMGYVEKSLVFTLSVTIICLQLSSKGYSLPIPLTTAFEGKLKLISV